MDENYGIRYSPPGDHILLAAKRIRSRPLWHLRLLVSLEGIVVGPYTTRGRSKSRQQILASPGALAGIRVCPLLRATLARGMRVMAIAGERPITPEYASRMQRLREHRLDSKAWGLVPRSAT